MGRVTQASCAQALTMIRTRTGEDYRLEYSYGRPRLMLGAGKEVSPRLPTGDMLRWMHAFLEGLDVREDAARAARLLSDAYDRGEEQGSVDWDDINTAHTYARQFTNQEASQG